jgi:hypothetical protein
MTGGGGESPTADVLPDDSAALTVGLVLFVVASTSAAALYAFARRKYPPSSELAAVPAGGGRPRALIAPARRFSDVVDDEEAGLPRWLRPSVRAERFWTPERDAAERQLRTRRNLAFTEPPKVDGATTDSIRMIVRYDDVTLLDGPNESYAAIVGHLHTGDEVLVTRLDEDWAEVRTPRGTIGWVPSMGLTTVPAPPPVEPPRDQPVTPAPEPRKRRTAKASRSRSPAKPRPASDQV